MLSRCAGIATINCNADAREKSPLVPQPNSFCWSSVVDLVQDPLPTKIDLVDLVQDPKPKGS